MNKIKNSELTVCLSLFLVVLLTYFIYSVGLSGIFLLDDYDTLKRLNENGGVVNLNSFLQFVFANPEQISGRPVSVLSFLLDDQFWPGNPATYKHTNVLFHLLIGVLAFWFVIKLFRSAGVDERASQWMALLIASIWLLHPLNVSTVLYIVQRMMQLTTLFILAGLIFYLYQRDHIFDKGASYGRLIWLTVGLLFFGGLAALSKENGVLLFPLVLVLEWTIFSNKSGDRLYQGWLRYVIVGPMLLVIGYVLYTLPSSIFGYGLRDYTMFERVLTEFRILVEYLSKIYFPTITGMSLFHDDILVSKSLISPISTLLSALLILGSFLWAIIYRKKYSILACAVIVYFVAHSLESTIIPLELYYEHRNYLPMLGPILLLVYGVYTVLEKMNVDQKSLTLISGFSLFVVFSAFGTYQLSKIWSDPLAQSAVWAAEHPNSPRSLRVHAHNLNSAGYKDEALRLIEVAQNRFPRDLSFVLSRFIFECESGRDVSKTVEILGSNMFEASDGVVPNLSKMMLLLNSEGCRSLNELSLKPFIVALPNMPGMDVRKKNLGVVYFLSAEYFIYIRDFAGAINSLNQAYRYNKDPLVLFKKVELLEMAGVYDTALDILLEIEGLVAKNAYKAEGHKHLISKLRTRLNDKMIAANEENINE